MKRSIFSFLAIAAVPALLAAQNPPPQQGQKDTTKADSTLNRRVNQTNQSGDTTGRTRTTPTTGQQGGQRDSLPADRAAQGTTPGRTVNQANESGDTTPSALRDSLLRANQGATVERGGDVSRTGGARSSSRNFGLDRSQVMQLQEALNGIGCNAGTVDGIVGPRTRAAMSCARSQNNIQGNDNDALFRALNLDFGGTGGAADTTGTTDTTRTRDTTGTTGTRDTTGTGTGDSTRVRPDSATTRPDSTRPTPPR